MAAPRSSQPQETYEAFKTLNRNQLRLKVRPVSQAWERLSYAYLLRIVEDNGFGTSIALVFTFCVVVIKGHNLQPIVEAIDAECCEYVQQFDSSKWSKPTDAAAPFVESIQIHSEQDGSNESPQGAKKGGKA